MGVGARDAVGFAGVTIGTSEGLDRARVAGNGCGVDGSGGSLGDRFREGELGITSDGQLRGHISHLWFINAVLLDHVTSQKNTRNARKRAQRRLGRKATRRDCSSTALLPGPSAISSDPD
eukprot:SAG31_NODE_6185_length_2132_cov_2.190851_3_plen_120_part_00